MSDILFRSHLLREKIVISGLKKGDEDLVVLGNRFVIGSKKTGYEDIIVRAKTMQSCLRLSAYIMTEIIDGDRSILDVPKQEWDDIWGKCQSGYDKEIFDGGWVAVYNVGEPVYKSGAIEEMFDVIEKNASTYKGTYEESFDRAKEAFASIGKAVEIEHDNNVGLIAQIDPVMANCGIVIRSLKKGTFNYKFTDQEKRTPVDALRLAANYLEGIQLSFTMGISYKNMTDSDSKRAKEATDAYNKSRAELGKVKKRIATFDDHYEVLYRPEPPQFNEIIAEIRG